MLTSMIDRFPDAIPYIMEGQVVSTADPDQMGRTKVWVPALDGEDFEIDQLPWADYASPFFGFTVEYPGGNGSTKNSSHAAYGMWAIPKIGSTVLVFCLNADPRSRFYFASTLRLHRNRSMPAGRNTDFNGNKGPFGDAGDGNGNLNPIEPAYSNLKEQFQDDLTSSESMTRGAYERQVAQSKDEKDGTEGYSKNPADTSYLDPQTYCIVTPGRHAIIMQDDPQYSRLRLKTGEGHQIIFDDANERIYVSTAKGGSWIELDLDGHVHVFGAASLSMRAGVDINMFADRDINIEAGRGIHMKADNGDFRVSVAKDFHLKATGSILQSACGKFALDGEASMYLTAANNLDLNAGNSLAVTGSSSVHINGGGSLIESAGQIQLNSGSARIAEKAVCPEAAQQPSIVPGHEPWKRPASKLKRNKNWKA